MIEDLVLQVLETYEKADIQYKQFTQETKFQCPPLCGQCCKYPEIEVTVLEMLPMALELITANKIQEIYPLLQQRKECAFFIQSMLNEKQGQCSQYQYRPLICRLFGALKTKNKNNQDEFVTCEILKQIKSEELNQIVNNPNTLEKAPLFNYWKNKVSEIHPDWGKELFPINIALKNAIDKLLLIKDLEVKDKNS